MIIGTCKVYLRADWVYSLKGKRMVVKSIIEKSKHKFNVSIAEVENMDSHETIVIGFACVSNNTRHADSMVRNILRYIENNTDAVVEDVIIEMR